LAKPVVDRLKRRARRGGRSLEAEVRAILEEAAQPDPAAAWKLADRIRRGFGGRKFSDSAALIREDRDR
jgi:plasmid stability protein